MGKTTVAICLAPARLNINGETTDLVDGKSLSLPDGVDVNVYVITGQSGDSVRAELNPTWINVYVGLGRWPTQVSGLLANAKNVNEIETREGIVLTNRFSLMIFMADMPRAGASHRPSRCCSSAAARLNTAFLATHFSRRI